MIPAGRVRPGTAIRAALVWTVLALGTAAVISFTLDTGAVSFVMMTVGVSLALSYSLKPLMLSYRGLGEVLMAFMVSFLTPVTSSYIILGGFNELIVWTSLPLALQLFALMMVVEIPDRDADREAGKGTLAVRLGNGLSWNIGVMMLVAGGVASLTGYFAGLPLTAAVLSGIILLLESVVFLLMGEVPKSGGKTFWSTAISCGFYVLVIVVMAVNIV